MPRQAREIEIGVPLHITQRGNERQDIFRDDEDKAFYIYNFQKYKKRFRVKMYAWCLMDNHVHFVVEPGTIVGVSKFFSCLNNLYVSYFNSKYSRRGRLFESRFYSCLLSDDHFVEALRYVELNPVRAGLESEPGFYLWSSAKERLGLRKQFYLSSIPRRIFIDDWKSFLSVDEVKEETWNLIRSKTQSTKSQNGGNTDVETE